MSGRNSLSRKSHRVRYRNNYKKFQRLANIKTYNFRVKVHQFLKLAQYSIKKDSVLGTYPLIKLIFKHRLNQVMLLIKRPEMKRLGWNKLIKIIKQLLVLSCHLLNCNHIPVWKIKRLIWVGKVRGLISLVLSLNWTRYLQFRMKLTFCLKDQV